MSRRHVILAMLLAMGGCGSDADSAPPAAAAPARFLGTRGINIHNWFTWTRQTAPDTYAWPAFQHQPGEVAADEAAALRRAGFDFVRLTVDPGVFMAAGAADRADSTRALVTGIERLTRAGLSVIVDLHGISAYQPPAGGGAKGAAAYQRGPGDPVTETYRASAATLAGDLDRRFGGTGRVAFEAFNEPTLPCGSTSWRAQQAALHRAIRAAAPRLTLVLNGSCWDNIDGLLALNPADYADANALYTFHFYEPFTFTHQGVGGGDPVQAASGGFPYPWNARPEPAARTEVEASMALAGASGAVAPRVEAKLAAYLQAKPDRATIESRMDAVAEWARRTGVPPSRILMGEFGVNVPAGAKPGARDDDRMRWLADTRQAAEAHGFRWAAWLLRGNLSDGFSLSQDGRLPRPVTQALGLKPGE